MMAAALSLPTVIHTGEYFLAILGYLCSVVAANKIESSTRDFSGIGVVSRIVLGEVTVVTGIMTEAMDTVMEVKIANIKKISVSPKLHNQRMEAANV